MDPNLLPEYRCHKVVRGAEIVSSNIVANTVTVRPDPDRTDTTADIQVPADFFARGIPAPRDFLVVYEGGYLSWSPRKAWHGGYQRLTDGGIDDIRLIAEQVNKIDVSYPKFAVQRLGIIIGAAEDAIDTLRASMPKVEAPPTINEKAPEEPQLKQELEGGFPNITLTDGSPVTPDHRHLRPDGQQKGYVVLSAEERAKGFVRPVRTSYTHLPCGTETRMAQSIAETYARNPGFYSGTFCCGCRNHFPVGADGEFVWSGTDEKVGT